MTRSIDSLLAQIVAEPQNNTPRLALAQQLEAQGDARGEFIKVQIDLTRRLNPARRRQLIQREAALLADNQKLFSQTILPFIGKGNGSWSFSRGFIESISATATPLLIEGLADVVNVEPLRRLSLHYIKLKQLKSLLAAQVIGRLKRLGLQGTIGDNGARALAESPQLTGLYALQLEDCNIGDNGIRALFGKGRLRCHQLSLRDNQITAEGAAAIAASPHLAEITSLNLARNTLADDGVIQLVGSPHFRCQRLTLNENELTDAAAIAISRSPQLQSCKELYLSANPIGDEGLTALINSSYLCQLKILTLRYCELTDESAQHLSAQDLFPQMQRLELEQTDYPLSDNIRRRLRERWGSRIHLYPA